MITSSVCHNVFCEDLDDNWRRIPAWGGVSEADFGHHAWQARHVVTDAAGLAAVVGGLVPHRFIDDVVAGLARSPMAMRLTPYLISRIDWSDPYNDPLRVQFVPVASLQLPDHPVVRFDSLDERRDAVSPGLTHRYPDRALLLALDTCPVYCRFCTRSYAVGADTPSVEKEVFSAKPARWREAIEAIRTTPAIKDVVLSGGDAYHLRPQQLEELGSALLGIPHVRRIRVATKGPAVLPQKLVSDHLWVDALTGLCDRGRRQGTHVALHTHFNHVNEISDVTRRGLGLLFERGVTVRNQSVLLRGVNDSLASMAALVRALGDMQVIPYYVYVHDLVPGAEELRTPLSIALDLEVGLRGMTAGFMTPNFVLDAPGGGGKRLVHSFRRYDRLLGVSVFEAPAVAPGRFAHVDPLWSLSPEGRQAWSDAPHEVLAQVTNDC